MGNNRIRIQLQQGTLNIASESSSVITAEEALRLLHIVHTNGKKHQSDAKWVSALDAAVKKAEAWIKSTKAGGGYIGQSSGTAKSIPFDHGGKKYRIDIEVHGEKDPGWFR